LENQENLRRLQSEVNSLLILLTYGLDVLQKLKLRRLNITILLAYRI